MADSEMTSVIRRVGIFSWSVIGVLLLAAAAFFVLVRGRIILAPLLLSVLIIFILNPLVSWLHRKGVPRFIGVILGFMVFFSSVALLAIALLPDIVAQAQSFVDTFPALYDNSVGQLKDLLASTGFETSGVLNYDQCGT